MIGDLLRDTCWGDWWSCNVTEIFVFGIPSYLIGLVTGVILLWLYRRFSK